MSKKPVKARPITVEEQVARHIAAADWVEDPADDAWWRSRRPDFRDNYLTYAQQIIAIVRAADTRSQP
ncbi:hypothetical protein ACIPY6_03045 [Streptomyces sp. NPDC090054]|uniref:hypothetical protein n=1 Tax=Streptomyces sp. NPDC090054 TaxID=3365933 RepID=UPI0037F23E0E